MARPDAGRERLRRLVGHVTLSRPHNSANHAPCWPGAAGTAAGSCTAQADDPRKALADRYSFVAPSRFEREQWATGLVDHLEEHGYAVAAGVLDSDEIATTYSLLFDHIEERSGTLFPDNPVSRTDSLSWGGVSTHKEPLPQLDSQGDP